MHVLVLFNESVLGPQDRDWASEAGVSESVEALSVALATRGHSVGRLGLSDSVRPLVDAVDGQRPFDVVVNLCESFRGHSAFEPHIAALVELLDLPYTGSTAETLSLVRDKALTKWLLLGAGLPTAAFERLDRTTAPRRAMFEPLLARGPLFVKPAAEDASLGIGPDSVVADFDSLVAKVADLQRRYGDVLVEQFVAGREFNVGIVALPEPMLLPLAEIVFAADPNCPWPIVTYDAKWNPGSSGFQKTPVTCPAEVDEPLAREIREVSLAAFRQTNCRDYARVDLRIGPEGRIFILEVNANPDLSPAAGFARALGVGGIAYDDFAERLITQAAARRRRTG